MSTREVSMRTTLVTGVLLLGLWAASFGVSYVALGSWSLPLALTIAGAKALLVALFFMELVHERASLNLALGAAVTLIAILIAFMVGDVATRPAPPLVPPRATHPLAQGGAD
jgi:cytochrome c oxidase subunit 4